MERYIFDIEIRRSCWETQGFEFSVVATNVSTAIERGMVIYKKLKGLKPTVSDIHKIIKVGKIYV